MRDALSLLDQAISYSENEVTLDDVLSITGAVSHTFMLQIVRSIAEKNLVSALHAVEQLIQNGKDPVRFLEDLI
ncbi:hypothetical protein KZ310_34345, partial [Escherichia coli]|nr:hypothetical protein [Escherichia coli]